MKTKIFEVTFEPTRVIVQVQADSITEAADKAVDYVWEHHALTFGQDEIETIEEEDEY